MTDITPKGITFWGIFCRIRRLVVRGLGLEVFQTTAVPVADKTADLSSLRCPNLVIGIIRALRTVPPAGCCASRHRPQRPLQRHRLSRQSRNDLIEMYEENGRFIFTCGATRLPEFAPLCFHDPKRKCA